MKIISWNVNGIRAAVKKGFIDSMESVDADVICLQEIKAQDDQIREALFGIGYEIHSYSAEKKGYSGTAILTKQTPISICRGIGKEEHDNEGRVLTVELEKLFVISVYTPNSKRGLLRIDYREQWDKDFSDYVNQLRSKKPVIVCGDLNVAHSEIDLARPKSNFNKTAGYTQREIDGLTNLLNTGFVDSFRLLYPDEVKYSWWSYRAGAREKNIGWRLDYVLASEELKSEIKEAFILNEIHGSDHCPVGIVLGLD